MSRKADVTWIRFAVNLSAGEIQKHYGIPASVVYGYRTGRFQIHEDSLHRLENAYKSHQYHRMIDAGVSRREAKNFSKKPPQEVSTLVRRQREIAEEIYVKSGISKSFDDFDYGLDSIIIPWMNDFKDRSIHDWDIYTKTKSWIDREEFFEKYPEKRTAIRKAKRTVKRKAKRKRR